MLTSLTLISVEKNANSLQALLGPRELYNIKDQKNTASHELSILTSSILYQGLSVFYLRLVFFRVVEVTLSLNTDSPAGGISVMVKIL